MKGDATKSTADGHGEEQLSTELQDLKIESSSIPATAPAPVPTAPSYPQGKDPRLRYKPAYWWPYRTFVKERWIGRELLEVVSTEFRDRSVDYYRHALESGVTSVNGARVGPKFILRNGDRIE